MRFFTIFKTTFLFFLTVFTLNLEANPTFARQYGMECSACHSQVPALNDMGLGFLRNGLRTSSYDVTALKSFLDDNSSNQHYPIGAMIGLSGNSNNNEMNQLVKLYLSGTVTDSLSLMASTKESFSSDKEGQKLFESANSQFYFQYNISEAKHVFRVGLLSPWTQLGNVKRSMSNSGLHGGAGHGNNYFSPLNHANVKKIKGAEYSYLTDNNILFLVSYGATVDNSSNGYNNSYTQNNSNDQSNLNSQNNSNSQDNSSGQNNSNTQNNSNSQDNSSGQNNSNTQDNSNSQDNSSGQNNLNTQDNSNSQDNSSGQNNSNTQDNSNSQDNSSGQNNSNTQDNLNSQDNSSGQNNSNTQDNSNSQDNLMQDKSKQAFLAAIKYTTSSNYKIGLIYNYVDMERDDYYSLILPIEKEYKYFVWNSSLVYVDYSSDDYIGLENAFTFPLRDMEHLKLIVNVDKDENDDTNFAYSLGYTKIYKIFSFSIVAGHIETDNYSDDRIMGSIQLIL